MRKKVCAGCKRMPAGADLAELRANLFSETMDRMYERGRELGAPPKTSWGVIIELIWNDYCSSRNIRAETK